jgi:peroxiredoxin
MTISGKSDIKDAYKIEILNSDRDVLASSDLTDGSFSLEVKDIKYPIRGSVKISVHNKRFPSKVKRLIIENADLKLEFKDGKMGSIKGGKLNDELLSSWEESWDFKGALRSWNDFKHAGRYIYQSKYTLLETKMQLKEMYYTLRDKVVETKENILKPKLKNSSAAVQLIILQEIGIDKDTRKYLDYIEKELGQSKTLEKLRDKEKYLLKHMKAEERLNIGKPLVDFVAKTNKAKNVKLSSVAAKNKYTLLNFEDCSYYGSCDQYKTLRKAYKKYNKSGLDIVAFSMTEDKAKWLKSIKEEKLSWINCNDGKGEDSPVLKSYRINKKSLPANFLLDSKGNIVAKNLFGRKLTNKLKELLKADK